MELSREHWPMLKDICKQYWSFWPELVFELLPAEYSQLEPVDSDSTEFTYLEGKIWHWTSTKHYKKKIPALAGGPIIPYGIELGKDDYYPIRSEALPKTSSLETEPEEKCFLWGFRCCIPVFTYEDMENIEPVDN
ncbi:MAG: hypothetical protein GY749_00415 [Desulfobacteraceae bacterium]|nr:hypothetical protein [Desulfobacteraceae bacterium]